MGTGRLINNSSRNPLILPSVYLAYIPISVVSILLAMYDRINSVTFLPALYAALSSTSVTWLFLWAINSLWLRSKFEFKYKYTNIAFFVAATLTGIFRGASTYIAIENTEITQPTSLVSRIFTSTANVVFWLYLLDRSISETSNYSQRYLSAVRSLVIKRALISANQDDNPQRDGLNSTLSDEDVNEFERFQRAVVNSIDPVLRGSFESNDLAKAAASVRLLIEENLRPLSQRIWLRGLENAPKFKKRVAINAGLTAARFNPFTASLLLSISASINLVSTFGVLEGLRATILTVCSSIFFFSTVQRINKNRKVQRLSSGLLIHTIPGLGVALIFNWYNSLMGFENLDWENLTFVPVSMCISIFLSIIYLNRIDRTRIIHLLDSSSIELDTTKFERGMKSQDIASYLHNSLQSELIALSMQAESNALEMEVLEARSILERLASKMNRSLGDNFREHLTSTHSKLNDLALAWRGIADVIVNVPRELLDQIENSRLVLEIVEEGITNAIRYQHATRIYVDLNRKNGRLELRIESWGETPQDLEAESRSGLGSKFLNALGAEKWRREIANNRTILVVELD